MTNPCKTINEYLLPKMLVRKLIKSRIAED